MALTRTQKRNRKNKKERRQKASETRHRKSSETRHRKSSETRRQKASEIKRRHASRKIQTVFRNYNKLDKCGICLLAVRPNLQEYCHNFHPKCIAKWKTSINANNQLCPTCREPLLRTTLNYSQSQNEVLDIAENVLTLHTIINTLVSEINSLEYGFFSYTENEELGAQIQRILTMFDTFMADVAEGKMNEPTVINFLAQRESILEETRRLIAQLEEEHEILQETDDTRASH